MTQAEKILVRWLSAIAASVSAMSAALIGFETDVAREVLIGLTVAGAGLSALVATLTVEAASRGFGVRRSD